MIQLSKSLAAWGSPDFEVMLKRELALLEIERLPLQQGLAGSSYATDSRPQFMIISSCELGGVIRVRAGIFYTGIIAGCACADDPTPVEEQAEYCEVQIDIDRTSGVTAITLLKDD